MVNSPERMQPAQPEQVVQQVPETVDVAESLAEQGVSAMPSQFTAQVTDDQGNSLIHTPADQPVITISVPADAQTLENKTHKGSIDDSATWNTFYWFRMIQKAFHFGWRVVVGSDK